MKVCLNLLGLCVFQLSLWGANAFSPTIPQGLDFNKLSSSHVTSTPPRLSSALRYTNSWNEGLQATVPTSPNIWETLAPDAVTGNSLRTWSFPWDVERVQVLLHGGGLPVNGNVELWHGPDGTPQKMSIYSDDDITCPVTLLMETPRGMNSIAIRNNGYQGGHLSACVGADVDDVHTMARMSGMNDYTLIQDRQYAQYPFDPNVSSVLVFLRTDHRPLHARIEVYQGPYNHKQIIDVYTEDGTERPFLCVIETPEPGSVVQVVNTAPAEYAIAATVQACSYHTSGNHQGNENRLYGYADDMVAAGGNHMNNNPYGGYGYPFPSY
jgi:hypothetical protein